MALPKSLEATKLKVDVHRYHYTQRFPGPDSNDVTERWEKAKKPFGKGGYGTVWRVYELAGPRRIRAVKIVAKANVALRELEGLVALNDYEGHFTHFYGWWEDAVNYYILMEFMPGGNLEKLMSPGVSEPVAIDIARQILQGIEIMHSRHIIHRDLKPANILLANKPGKTLDVRIADLGTCKILTEDDAKTRGPGTPGFTAPEVLHAPGKIDEMSNYDVMADMWSLGCLIHAVLTGHSPYPTDDVLPKPADTTTTFPANEKVLLARKVSELGIDFITQLVTVDPKARPTAKAALQHRWLLTPVKGPVPPCSCKEVPCICYEFVCSCLEETCSCKEGP